MPLLFAFFLSVFHVCEPIEWGGKESFRERERVRKQKLVNLSISTISVTLTGGTISILGILASSHPLCICVRNLSTILKFQYPLPARDRL